MSRNWQDILVGADWQLRKELTAERQFQIADFQISDCRLKTGQVDYLNLKSAAFNLQSFRIPACSSLN